MYQDKITEKVIGCAFKVMNTLGNGFLEKVYENALAVELRRQNVSVEQQGRVVVMYDGVPVGDYCPDLLVDGEVVVEIKAVKHFQEIHVAQVLNYLRATNSKTGLLLNFGQARLGVRRLSM